MAQKKKKNMYVKTREGLNRALASDQDFLSSAFAKGWIRQNAPWGGARRNGGKREQKERALAEEGRGKNRVRALLDP